MIKGRVTSIESMGLVDGPGIRTVIFFAGCSLRCSFCHNPETWCAGGGELYSTLDKYGIDFNATTYNELVQFYISGAKENFSVAAEIILQDYIDWRKSNVK